MSYPKPSHNGRHDPRTIFTTLSGAEIHFEPFSWDEYQMELEAIRDEYRARGEPIDCPQYEIVLADGSTKVYDHDENSIKQTPPNTPEDEKQTILDAQAELWQRYHETLAKFKEEDGELMSDLVYNDSLVGIELPKDDAWEKKQRRRRMPIPEDPEEKRRHYINTVLLKSKADQLDLISTITAVSMGVIKEADLQHVRDSFRDNLYGQLTQTLRDTTIPAPDQESGEVESK